MMDIMMLLGSDITWAWIYSTIVPRYQYCTAYFVSIDILASFMEHMSRRRRKAAGRAVESWQSVPARRPERAW